MAAHRVYSAVRELVDFADRAGVVFLVLSIDEGSATVDLVALKVQASPEQDSSLSGSTCKKDSFRGQRHWT